MRAKNLRFILVLAVVLSENLIAQQTATTPVFIVVNDPSGAGIPGANIRVVPAPDPAPKMETDSKGKLALNLKPGGYALFVRCQGFKSFETHFDVHETKDAQTVPVVLQIGASGSPMVSPATAKDDLVILAYPYHEPAAFSPSDFKALPHTTVTVHNSHTNVDETYSGVRLADLLAKMNAPLGNELHGEALANYIVATGSDDYEAVLALAEVDPAFHPGEVIVADTMNNQPLDAHSGPFKLVVSEDKRPARAVRNLTTIELRALR